MNWLLSIFLFVYKFGVSSAGPCDTKFSDANFIIDFEFHASSETTSNNANEVFTVGWCPDQQNGSPNIDVDFKQSYGIRAILVSDVGGKFSKNTLVKYVPNGGDVNNFVNFPLQTGKLEVQMSQPGTVQSDFGQSIAVRKLQFTIQGFHGDSCLKIDLIGCPIDEVCPGGCLNNGICVMQDTCQCAQGYLGNNCENKECHPENLGLSTGIIGADDIKVSSQDPVYNKGELGNSDSKKGWCPALGDYHPWVEIQLDQPKAISVFSFMWSDQGNQKIMTEFELQYISPIDSSRRFRTFATDIPAMNSTHIFTVTTQPVVVTDNIRIIPSKWIRRACFKLEVQGCNPKELCSLSWCQNGGTCMGENICLCPSGFVGNRCEKSADEIFATNLTFVNIINNVITTTSKLQFSATGNVHLDLVGKTPVVTINGTDSCIKMNHTEGQNSCITDVNLCNDGFTYSFDVNFGHLLNNTYIVSSGGNLPGHSGITLYYTNKQLVYIVSTTTQKWTLVTKYEPVLHKWQHFEITWNKHLGVELLVDGHSLGSNSRPKSNSGNKIVGLVIGCSHAHRNVNNNIQMTGIHFWAIDRTQLVNAGIKDPELTSYSSSTTPTTSSTSTTYQTTTFNLFRSSTKSVNVTSSPSLDSTTSTSKRSYILEDSIDAQCTSYGWNISIDLNTLQLIYPGIKPIDIYMGSEKCKGSIHENKLWYEQSFRICNTSKEMAHGTNIYSNVLYYATVDPNDPSLIRKHIWTFKLACYVSSEETASYHLSHDVDIHSKNITAHHDISLAFYKDQNFVHRIQGDPLRVTVGDNIYVKVSTSSPDWDTKMRLHTCFTRSSDRRAAEHVLIRDGCEEDGSTHIISQSTHETKFVFRDFEYLTLNEGLDIFCNATFCNSSDFSPVCTQACRQGPSLIG